MREASPCKIAGGNLSKNCDDGPASGPLCTGLPPLGQSPRQAHQMSSRIAVDASGTIRVRIPPPTSGNTSFTISRELTREQLHVGQPAAWPRAATSARGRDLLKLGHSYSWLDV